MQHQKKLAQSMSKNSPNLIQWGVPVDGRFAYQVGDLVSFNSRRLTEDYIDDFVLTGVVIKQRYVFTADNKFLVRTPEKDYWVPRPALTLLSRAQNKS